MAALSDLKKMIPVFKNGTEHLSWEEVLKILDAKKDLEKSQKTINACHKVKTAFENSYIVQSVLVNGKLVGVCRALSDGVKQSVIYDLNILEEFQSQGLGQQLLKNILNQLPNGPIILYAMPGKESYYKQFGFQNLLTGMALFPDEERRALQGFIK